MNDWVHRALQVLEGEKRLRHLRAVIPVDAVTVQFEGRHIRLFSSNDYLGLSMHPRIREAVARVSLERGMGTRGSALICGYTDLHEELEMRLARLKGTESTLIFPTGYAANTGLIGALGSPETAIFSDALNHASIIDGCRLARCPVHVYRHLDMDHLATLLRDSSAARKVIISDALFSMDGETAPLATLVELKRRYGATLLVDEAHSTLVYGPSGEGLVASLGLSEHVDFQVGTLSKALGVQGGFVAMSRSHRSWLLNTARSYVFSTALPAPMLAAAIEALDIVRDEPQLVRRLWDRVAQLSEGLSRPVVSPIVPFVVGDEHTALALSARLLQAGFHVPAIRPPTVPVGTCRLRITCSAAHREEDVAELINCLETGS